MTNLALGLRSGEDVPLLAQVQLPEFGQLADVPQSCVIKTVSLLKLHE